MQLDLCQPRPELAVRSDEEADADLIAQGSLEIVRPAEYRRHTTRHTHPTTAARGRPVWTNSGDPPRGDTGAPAKVPGCARCRGLAMDFRQKCNKQSAVGDPAHGAAAAGIRSHGRQFRPSRIAICRKSIAP